MNKELILIAENIHTTRVVLSPERKGKKSVLLEDGCVAVKYTALDGSPGLMRLPESVKESPQYAEGKIKHVRVAIEKGMAGEADGVEYLQSMAKAQVETGADFLDVNVDEISPEVEKQVEAMDWIVGLLAPFSAIPLSIDSSNSQVIEAGLKACDLSKGQPLINSASLERPELLDLAVQFDAGVVVSAFGTSGMPSGVEDRVANVGEMMKQVEAHTIPPARIYLDPLVFPVATDSTAGNSFLESVRRFRSAYGSEVHITGGLSNVSFGVPARKLLNEVFLVLAMEAGCDSAIIDPIQVRVDNIRDMDRESLGFRLASDALTGKDMYCMEYVTAFREGKI